jgi:hypothetical protein
VRRPTVAASLAGDPDELALGTSSAAPASRASGAKLPVDQLVALARDELRGLDDMHVKTASVVATTKNSAENWMEPGAVPPTHPDPMVYLIAVHGRFICESAARSAIGPWSPSPPDRAPICHAASPNHHDEPRPAPKALLPTPHGRRPRKTERPQPICRNPPITHHVSDPLANPSRVPK